MANKNKAKERLQNCVNYVFEEKGFDDLNIDEQYLSALRDSFIDQMREDYNDLIQCEPYSLHAATKQAARLGLLLSGRYDEAYLVNFGNEASLMLDYKGQIKVAKRSPNVEEVNSAVLYEGDDFQIDEMNPDQCYHRRSFRKRGGKIGAWAKFFRSDGADFVRALDAEQIEKVQKSSENKKIWVQHENEMWRKTVIRNGMKMIDLPHQTARVLEKIESDEPDYESLDEEQVEDSEHKQVVQGNEGVKQRVESDSDQEEEGEPEEEPSKDEEGGQSKTSEESDQKAENRLKRGIQIAKDLGIDREDAMDIARDCDHSKHFLNKMKKAEDDSDYEKELKEEFDLVEKDESDEPDVPDHWDADVNEYHTGKGWYKFPDGNSVRGTSKAEDYLEEKRDDDSKDLDDREPVPISEGSDEEGEQDEEPEDDIDKVKDRFEGEDESEDEPEDDASEGPEEVDSGNGEASDDEHCSECGKEIENPGVIKATKEDFGESYCAVCAVDMQS